MMVKEWLMAFEMDVFCILLLSRILYQMYKNRSQSDHWNYFILTIIAVLFYLFMDTVWLLNIHGILAFSKLQSGFLNSFYFISLSFTIAFWYTYAQKTLHSKLFQNRIKLIISFLPLGLFIGGSILSYWTHWLYYVGFNGIYHRGAALPYFFMILFGYILYISIKASILSRKVDNYLYQKEYRMISRFSFLPFVTAIIQIIYPKVFIFNLGLTYSIFIVYNYFQQDLISLDPLTKINNREQLDNYLTIKMRGDHSKKDLYLFILDIDKFKKINDEYGHVVGDEIILKTAQVLKQIAHKHHCFISRYGGDEFIMVHETKKGEAIERVFNDIKEMFDQESQDVPSFSVSIGYAKYDKTLKYIPDFIEKADQYMYLNKNEKK